MAKFLVRCSSLWVLLLAGTAAADPRVDTAYIPDIETFLQIGSLSTPAISADGKRAFFVSNMSGVNQLYRLTDAGWPYQLTVYPDGIDFYVLAPDGRSAVAGVSVGGDEQSGLVLIDGETGRPRKLTVSPKIQHGSVLFARDGTQIYYRSNEANGRDFHVYRMTLAERQATAVFAAEGYNSPAAESPDGRRLIVATYHSNENSDLYLVQPGSRQKPRHLTPHEGKVVFTALGFAPDGRSLFIVTNGNPDGIARPARLDLEHLTIAPVLPPSPWEVEESALSPDGNFLALVQNEEGYSRLHLYRTDDFSELPVPPLDGIIGSVGFSALQSLIFDFSSPTKAPDAWLWEWNVPQLRKLTNTIYAGIDPALFRDPQLVKIKSFDGLEVPAFLYLPADYRKGKPIPFLIDFHGGPESQFRPYFIRNFQYMMLNGFGILAPNVRGSSGYGRDYQALDNYKLRMNSVKDGGACARWLIEQGYTTPARLGVRGGSYGGFMVLAAITEFPELFGAACDVVGIANFQTFLENTSEYRRALREAEYGPLSDPEFLASVSPIYKADKIQTPLLVVHGENDPRVPVGEARQIAAAIAARGGVVDTLIFPDEGHGASKRSNVLLEYRTQVDFFSRHLKK